MGAVTSERRAEAAKRRQQILDIMHGRRNNKGELIPSTARDIRSKLTPYVDQIHHILDSMIFLGEATKTLEFTYLPLTESTVSPEAELVMRRIIRMGGNEKPKDRHQSSAKQEKEVYVPRELPTGYTRTVIHRCGDTNATVPRTKKQGMKHAASGSSLDSTYW